MIIVRDVFKLQFGKAKEGIKLLKQGQEALKQAGYPADRVLADLTGDFYTLVLESRVESLAQYEESLATIRDIEGWQEAYGRFAPLVHSGRREIFREVG
ncbi:MAG: hypothetical protein R6W77_15575 [Trueperaceae bacterium]